MVISEKVIDAGMRARIPGGSSFEDWMLPHDNVKGRENCREALVLGLVAMLFALAREDNHGY